MVALKDAAPVPTKEELLAALKPAIKSLVETEVSGDVDPDKSFQFLNSRRNYLMYRGLQNLAPQMGANGYADIGPVGGNWPYGSGGDGGAAESYDFVQNIFRGYGRKFIAVLGSRAPNVTAMPDDPGDEKSKRATQAANTCNSILDAWWSTDEKNLDATSKLWISGPAFLYTPWNADGDLYGYRQEPQVEAAQQAIGESAYHCQNCGADAPQPTPEGACPQCNAPMGPEDQSEADSVDIPKESGMQSYANGRAECHVCDVFRVTTPFSTTDMETCDWLKYEYETNKGRLLKKWPELRKMNLDTDMSSTNATGQMARDSTISPLGITMRRSGSRWTFTRIWFTPGQFELVKDEKTRELLKQNFATGLRVTMVQGEPIELEEEKLSELWSVIKPETSETINADPIGQDLVPVQLLKNHTLNISAETLERGIPQTMADPRVFDFQTYNKRPPAPAEVLPTLPTYGSNLSEGFYQLPAARFSDQQQPWIDSVVNEGITVCGVEPTIFGGGDASNTAREAEIRKNAALAQLNSTWTYIRKGWEKAKRNAVCQLAKYGSGIIREGALMVDLAELTEGGWHFEADEAIPATWGQMRDLTMFMMDKPPAVIEAWGLNRPENISRNKALLGMPGYYTPGEDDVEKVDDTIQQLLKGQPIQKPNQQGGMDILPSIPADEFEDNHALVVQRIQGWCQSKAGRKEREQNPQGYANVVAMGKQHAQMMQPPPPPPPPIVPKVSVAVSSKDLAPEQTVAILKDANIDVPLPPPPPPGMMGAPAQPGQQQSPPQGGPGMIQ